MWRRSGLSITQTHCDTPLELTHSYTPVCLSVCLSLVIQTVLVHCKKIQSGWKEERTGKGKKVEGKKKREENKKTKRMEEKDRRKRWTKEKIENEETEEKKNKETNG